MLMYKPTFILFILCLSGTSIRTRRNLPLEPFFELAIWAFEKHVGPVIFTGVSQKESSELAFSFIKYYSMEVTDNIIKINCSASQMDEVFRSIAEFYIKETQFETDSYEIINSLHEYFGNQNTLFILEDVDLDDKYIRRFIKVARESMLTDILITNVQSFIRGKFILLDFEIYKTRGLMYVVRGLTADLRMKYMEDHNLDNKKKDVDSMLDVYEKQEDKIDKKIQQYQDPLFLKYYNKFSFKKHNLESDEDEDEEDGDGHMRSNEKPYSSYLRKRNKVMKKFPKGLPKNLFQNERINDEFRDEVVSYGYKTDNNNYNNENNIDNLRLSRLRKSRNRNLEMLQKFSDQPEKSESRKESTYAALDENDNYDNVYSKGNDDTQINYDSPYRLRSSDDDRHDFSEE